MKLLIDTNIILDYLMKREPWAEAAQEIILAIAEEKIEGYITANSLTDIYYLLRKHLGKKEQAKHVLTGLIEIIKILDVNGADCEKALKLDMTDFEDALLICCGERNKVDHIVTRNLKDFEGSPISVSEPDAILKKLQSGDRQESSHLDQHQKPFNFTKNL